MCWDCNPYPVVCLDTCFREDMGKSGARMVTWGGFTIYFVTLIIIYCIDPSLTFLTDELSMQWTKEPVYVLPTVLTLGVVYCVVNEVYIKYFWDEMLCKKIHRGRISTMAGYPEENVSLNETVQN